LLGTQTACFGQPVEIYLPEKWLRLSQRVTRKWNKDNKRIASLL
jgi:hypothetical protein